MRIAFIGNCQVQSYAMLAAAMLDDAEIRVFDYSQPSSRAAPARAAFADGLHDCDWIFAQTALLSHTGERELRPRYAGKLVTIANFYFRGLFPDSCYIGDFAHRLNEPTAVHSVVVLDAFRRGLPEEAALRHFDPDIMSHLGALDAWSSSMHEMRLREANATVDVPAADFMQEACRRYPAFLTMNHPGAPLLGAYLQKVFAFAGIAHRPVNALDLPDPLASLDTTPILDEVAAYLRLPYRVSQHWWIEGLQRFMTRQEFVTTCYATYRQVAPASLLVHSPTDMVQAMASDPALAHLVDPSAPDPEPWRATAGGATGRPALAEMAQITAPIADSLAEVRTYIHKIHSYLEVIDPKVERLLQAIPTSGVRDDRVPRAAVPRHQRGRMIRSLTKALTKPLRRWGW